MCEPASIAKPTGEFWRIVTTSNVGSVGVNTGGTMSTCAMFRAAATDSNHKGRGVTKIKKIKISKLEAAQLQLETAVRLYFQDGDPVSIHTLTCAAYNVIRDVNTKRRGPRMFARDMFIESVKPRYQTKVRKQISAAENFFKHGQLGRETIDFNPEQSDWLIFEAASYYFKLTGQDRPLFKLFRGWYVGHHLSLLKLPAEEKQLLAKALEVAKRVGKRRYFELMLPVVARKSIAKIP
jgi:hypothetical protein